MAGGVNKVIIIGNLGKDPEVRYTPGGQAVANFAVATTESWNDKQGQKQERTEWHRIVVWGKVAELCGEYLAKGRQVYLEGKLQTRQWDDRDGNKRYTTEVVANTVQFLGSRAEGASSNGGGRRQPQQGYGQDSQQRQPEQASPSQGGGGDMGYDYGPPISEDEVPFHHVPRPQKCNV